MITVHNWRFFFFFRIFNLNYQFLFRENIGENFKSTTVETIESNSSKKFVEKLEVNSYFKMFPSSSLMSVNEELLFKKLKANVDLLTI